MNNTHLATLKSVGGHDVLRQAAFIIERDGWIQGVVRHRNTGNVDIVGALAIAMGAPYRSLPENIKELSEIVAPRFEGLFLALHDTLDAFLGVDPSWWNDQRGRTKNDVIRTLRNLANRIDLSL